MLFLERKLVNIEHPYILAVLLHKHIQKISPELAFITQIYPEPVTDQYIDLFLKYGVNPDAQDSSGSTALIYAALYNDQVIIKKLLDYKANPNIVDKQGMTALMYTTNLESAQLLLRHGANPNIKDSRGYTALAMAREEGNINLQKLLLRYSATA